MDKIEAIQWLRSEYRSHMGLLEARDLAESFEVRHHWTVADLKAAAHTCAAEKPWHQQDYVTASCEDEGGRFALVLDLGETPDRGFRWSVSEKDGTLVAEGVGHSWEDAKEQAEKHLRLQG